MANYYTDIPELKFHLNNPMMKRICELKERNYRDKDEFDYAPLDFEDAVDSYDKVLEITGEITGEIIAANAEGVDEEGPHCANGRVEYASGTKQNLDAMVKAGLNGTEMNEKEKTLLTPEEQERRHQVAEQQRCKARAERARKKRRAEKIKLIIDRKSTRLNSSHIL